jgi:CRP-like cAMP-binding protein
MSLALARIMGMLPKPHPGREQVRRTHTMPEDLPKDALPYTAPAIDRILQSLIEAGPNSAAQLAEDLDIKRFTVNANLAKLQRRGLVTKSERELVGGAWIVIWRACDEDGQ